MPDPLRHVRALAGEIGPRPAASANEARAARYIAEAARGFTHQVWLEPFRSASSPAPAWAFAFALSLAGGVALWLHASVGALLATVGAACFAGHAAGWIDLSRLFPQRDSQNVVAIVPAREAILDRLVLVAHCDTRTVLPWRISRVHEVAGTALVTLAVLRLPALAVAYAKTGHRVWAWASLLPLLLVAGGAVAVLLQAWRGRPDDGAVSGAGGVAVALAAGEVLARAPLRHTEVWVVFTGCREAGPAGLHALLHRYGTLLVGASFLVLDRFGSGRLAWTRSESPFPGIATPPDLAGLLAQVAGAHPEWGVGAVHLTTRRTQAFPLLDRRLNAAALLTLAPDQEPDQVRPAQLHNAARFVRAVAEQVDRRACAEVEREGR